MWKEEENGTERVNATRFAEAKATGAETLAVGCPFCMTMLSDAAKARRQRDVAVKDVAEIVAEKMDGSVRSRTRRSRTDTKGGGFAALSHSWWEWCM